MPRSSSIKGCFVTLCDGNRLFARCAGKKKNPVIVLLHGVDLSGVVFSCLQLKLARVGYFTIAFDLPGHGLSSNFKLPTLSSPAAPIPALAQFDANIVLEATTFLIQNRKFTLLGNSFGGFIAQIIGFQHPHRLRNLILLDTSPKFSSDQTGSWIAPKFAADSSMAPTFLALALGDEATRRNILEASVTSTLPYAHFNKKQQQTYINQYLEQLAQLNQNIGALELFSLAAGDLRSLVNQISVRTLVINGGVLRTVNGLIVGDNIAPWGCFSIFK